MSRHIQSVLIRPSTGPAIASIHGKRWHKEHLMEMVVCGIPFGTPVEKDALKLAKDHGFTSVQIYTFWRDFEPREDTFDWSVYDRQVDLIAAAGLKYLPFLIMGPKYGMPDWWLTHDDHVPLRCVEHGKDSPIESIWNLRFRPHIDRVLSELAKHYGRRGVLEAVMPGICGDYGESIFPVSGNWPGDYHGHAGFWCAGDDAVADFRTWLFARYATIEQLNQAWRSRHESFDDIRPMLSHRCSRTAYFDMVSWYRDAMTAFSEFWMARCRLFFPKLPLYLCTGGYEDPRHGSNFADQAKACAKYGSGIRLTNETNRFTDNFAGTAHCVSACRFYGAGVGLEPVGPITTEGATARVFGSLAYANPQIFHYYGNVFEADATPKPAAKVLSDYLKHFGSGPAEDGVAVFWPEDQAVFTEGFPQEVVQAANFIRRDYPASLISESMILDGALRRFKLLVMVRTHCTRPAALTAIARWVREDGGRLLLTGRVLDLELDPVPEFDELVGVGPDTDATEGHADQYVTAPPADLPRVAAIPQYHTVAQMMNLLSGTEILSATKKTSGVMAGGACLQVVSSMWRRTYAGGGWAIGYTGPINFDADPQALFADPGVFPSLLADVCEQSGVALLGTQPNEIARARLGKKILALTEKGIEVVHS